MGVRLRIVMGLMAGLILAGCSADYGTDQHGQKVPAAGVDGQWLVINYWAEWCAPCRKEIPELNHLAEEGKAKGFRVLGVNFDGRVMRTWQRLRRRWACNTPCWPMTRAAVQPAAQ